MKKIYLKPTTEEFKVGLQVMTTGSLNVNGDSGTGTVYNEELDEDNEVLSRRRNKWEDDYDEDEDW